MGGEGGAARKTAWLLPRPRGLSGNSPRAEEKPFLEKTLCRDCLLKKKKKTPSGRVDLGRPRDRGGVPSSRIYLTGIAAVFFFFFFFFFF